MAKLATMPRGLEPAGTPVDLLRDSNEASLATLFNPALDALRVPALIVDSGGEVVCSNAAARASCISSWSPTAVAAANATGNPHPAWVLTPLTAPALPGWSLVILRSQEVPRRQRAQLTRRQREVLGLLRRGLSNTAIAKTLGIRPRTVEFHVSAVFDKVGVNCRAALIATVVEG